MAESPTIATAAYFIGIGILGLGFPAAASSGVTLGFSTKPGLLF